MSDTIHRTFLIKSDKLPVPALKEGSQVTTGFISFDPLVYVTLSEDAVDGRRARTNMDEHATAEKPVAIERERRIEFHEGRGLFASSKKALVRMRHRIKVAEHIWRVEQFREELDGLWLAHIELDTPGDDFLRPDWLDREVSDDERYSDAKLVTDGKPVDA